MCIRDRFTTIYKANGILFSFRDYDLQMSLPVKSSTIVASRILILYGMNLGFTLLVMLPAAAVYTWMASPSPLFYLFFFFSLLAIPMVPIILATILGVLKMCIRDRPSGYGMCPHLLGPARFLPRMDRYFHL